MQSISIALSTLIPREQNSFQRATKVTAADSRLTQFDRQWIPDRRTPNKEGPTADCASSIPRNSQMVQVGWTSMSAGDVSGRSAALDQVPWSFVLQTPALHDSQLVLHSLRDIEPVELVVERCDSPRSYLRVQVTRRAAALSTRYKISVSVPLSAVAK